MTAPARPQHYADAAAEHVAADRAAVTALVGSYRDTLARGLDPLTALACVAGAAYQEMCSRRATRVIAAAVQMLAEMQAQAAHTETELAGTQQMLAVATQPRRWRDRDRDLWQERPDGLIALETENGLSSLFVCGDEDQFAAEWGPVTEVVEVAVPQQADQAGVDRHWGPLASAPVKPEPWSDSEDTRPKCGGCGCPEQWHKEARCTGDFMHCPCTGYVAKAGA